MTESELNDLYDHAVDLADEAFADLDEEHVEWVHARLVWNRRHGLDDAGAVTVH